jgi:hypothetical protein
MMWQMRSGGIPVDQPPAASGKTAQVVPDQRPALVKTIEG